MELSTELKSHIIIFIDKSVKFITTEQADIIYKESASSKKGVIIDDSFIVYSSMSKILTLKEYYEEYPKEKPPVYENQKYISQIQNPTPKARGLMLKGLKQFCNENPNALKAKAMYKKLSENIEVDNYWLEVYEKYINKNRTDSEEKHFKYAESKMKI